MRISITCPKCSHDFSAPDKLLGRRAKCPECGEGVRVIDSGLTSSAEMSSPSGEVKSRSGSMRRNGGQQSWMGFVVIGVIAAVVAGAAGLNHLQGLLQAPPVVVHQQPIVVDPAPAPVQPAPPPVANLPPKFKLPEQPDDNKPLPLEMIAEADDPDEFPALADQPENLLPKVAKRPKTSHTAMTRDDAEDEIDTDRGRRLLVEMKKLAVVREGEEHTTAARHDNSKMGAKAKDPGRNPAGFEPRGFKPAAPRPKDDSEPEEDPLWKRLLARCKTTLEVTGIKQISGEPDDDDAVLTVTLDSEPKDGDDGDIMVWTISAELVCADLSEDPARPEYAKVWKGEHRLGTLSQKSLEAGKLSGSIDKGLNDFFISLRAARKRAERAVEKANEADSDSTAAED